MSWHIRSLVEDALGWRPGRAQTLAEGDGRAVYKADGPDGAVVVKVDADPARIAREVAANRLAAGAGVPVAPILAVGLGPPAAFFVTAKVAGVPLSSSTPAAAVDAGHHLRAFHRIEGPAPGPPPPAGWADLVGAVAARHVSALVVAGVLDPAAAGGLGSLFLDLVPQLEARPRSLLHGDLLPAHVLVDAEAGVVTAFIDFGDVQDGDAALDLAVLTLDDDALLAPVLAGYGDTSLGMLGPYRLLCHLGAAHGLVAAGRAADAPLRRIREALGSEGRARYPRPDEFLGPASHP